MTDYVRDAAQDLLAACEELVEGLEGVDPVDSIGLRMARAAIAKARRQTCPRCLGNKTGWSRKARSYIKCSECKGKGWIP